MKYESHAADGRTVEHGEEGGAILISRVTIVRMVERGVNAL